MRNRNDVSAFSNISHNISYLVYANLYHQVDLNFPNCIDIFFTIIFKNHIIKLIYLINSIIIEETISSTGWSECIGYVGVKFNPLSAGVLYGRNVTGLGFSIYNRNAWNWTSFLLLHVNDDHKKYIMCIVTCFSIWCFFELFFESILIWFDITIGLFV